MVARRDRSGVEADLRIELLEAVDEALDAVIVREQAARTRVVATEDAANRRVEEQHAQAIKRAGAAISLQEQDSGHGRTTHLDLTRDRLDVVALKGAHVSRLGQVLARLGRS
jgi:hypothetical protein